MENKETDHSGAFCITTIHPYNSMKNKIPVDPVIITFVLLLIIFPPVWTQVFVPTSDSLTAVTNAALAWADYDMDGDQDLVVTGEFAGPDSGTSLLYRNDLEVGSGRVFTNVSTVFPGVSRSAVAWGDYDNDGDPDVLIAGYVDEGGNHTSIYQNDGGIFTDINAGLPGVEYGSASWGDFDNDGNSDILLTGIEYQGNAITRIYRNGEGSFADINAQLTGIYAGRGIWGDYDNDGDLDILLTGRDNFGTAVSKIYNNQSGIFIDMQLLLTGLENSTAVWGDYDADGDLDIVMTGSNPDFSGPMCIIYRNDAGYFFEISQLRGVENGSISWGDFDNDGDSDIIMSGWTQTVPEAYRTILYENIGDEVFSEVLSTGLVDAGSGSTVWADYDQDGDLDLALSGQNANGRVTRIFRNILGLQPNQPPGSPSGLSAEATLDSSVTLHWQAAMDDSTPATGLSYNLRIGTAPGGSDILSPLSDNNTGYRLINNIGNVNQNLEWTIRDLSPGTYYASVQAIDAGYAGSVFSPEISFEILQPYFNELPIYFTGISGGDMKWIDYDSDNDLDFFVAGDSDSGSVIRLYRNDGFSPASGWIFTLIPEVFPELFGVMSAWGDYDRDGDLDLVLQGYDTSENPVTQIYRNDGNNLFVLETTTPLIPLTGGYLAWGDMDNDGDLDLIQAGHISTVNTGQYYRNDGRDSTGVWKFTPLNSGVRGFSSGSIDLADFDNDMDLDILWSGFFAGAEGMGILRNDGAMNDSTWKFTDLNAGFPSASGRVCWGDFDSDGDADILMAGSSLQGYLFRVYRNDGPGTGTGWLFSEINLNAGDIRPGDAQWGDYDNDGDPDILFSGTYIDSQIRVTALYRNDGEGNFILDNQGRLPAADGGRVSFADYDNDGDLDIGITGLVSEPTFSRRITKIYRNIGGFNPNQPPQPPSQLIAEASGDSVLLNWQQSMDDVTPSPGLTYNLQLGVKQGSGNIISPMADYATGFRYIVRQGNTTHNTSWITHHLLRGKYYWSVQAIDNNIDGSLFSSVDSFTIGNPPTIIHNPPDTQEVNNLIPVQVQISGSVPVSSATLFYKIGGTIPYITLPMEPSGDMYVSEIPPEAVTSRGLSYFIEAVDVTGLISYSDTFSIQIRLAGDGVVKNRPQPAGNLQNSYRLISIPVNTDQKNPAFIFEDDLGPYDKTKWRLFQPNPDGSIIEYPEFSEVLPGRAYWLIVSDPDRIIDTGSGQTLNTAVPFQLGLLPGWNYIGNPFNFAVPVSALVMENNQLLDIRRYEGNWSVLSDSLYPFEGYAVYSETETNLFVNPDFSDLTNGGVSKRSISKNDYTWYIQISARSQEASDTLNFAGVGNQAILQWDEFDRPETPPIGEFVSVFFRHPEWERNTLDYTTDIRNEYLPGFSWEFTVQSNISGKVELDLRTSENFPSGNRACLVDPFSGEIITFRNSVTHRFSLSGGEKERTFILLTGNSDYLIKNLDSEKFLPQTFKLYQNFPNPFNPVTRIRYAVPSNSGSNDGFHVNLSVYNAAGQKVVTLVDEKKPAGYHEIEFDAAALASGVYIYQLRTSGFSQSRKMILIR